MAREFKEFIRFAEMTHVRTSPVYPQRNGKLERWHKSLKSEAIRPNPPLSLEDAQRVVGSYVIYYNTGRLHSAIGYLTPQDKLEGRADLIGAERDRKLEAAREARKHRRAALLGTSQPEPTTPGCQGSTLSPGIPVAMTPWRSLSPVSQWLCYRGRRRLTRSFFLSALPPSSRALVELGFCEL